MYLLDTNVVSELRKPKPHQGVIAWITRIPDDDLHLSAVTLGEIQSGVELTRRHDARKAEEIEHWLESVAAAYGILAAGGDVFRRWARLMHGRPDHHLEDGLIAATALVHGLILVTRNVADFEPFGVRLLNPFAPRPEPSA